MRRQHALQAPSWMAAALQRMQAPEKCQFKPSWTARPTPGATFRADPIDVQVQDEHQPVVHPGVNASAAPLVPQQRQVRLRNVTGAVQ